MKQSCCASSTLLPIVLLLLTIVQLTTTTSSLLKIREDCDRISKTSQCRCSELQDFEITCSTKGIDPFFTINIRHNIYVVIDCHRTDLKDFSLLPKMSIGVIPKIQFNQCSLPPLQPIQRVLQILGITRVNAVLLENGKLGSLTRLHFEGLNNLNYLRISSNGISVLPEDLFADLKNLTELDLHSNNVELPQNIFASLENLDFLELGDNNLQDLSPGIFRNQKKLNRLNLWSNSLTNLSKEDFEGVSSITDLDLSANKIVTLRPDVFSLLHNLKNINLNANYFESLPVGLFAENTNLSVFRLTTNRVPLKYLPVGLLSNLPILREVRLNCGLKTIPSDVFAQSTTIQNITISGNNLTELPYMLFADQEELIDLDLTRNKLISLPDDIFQNTRKIIVLRLSHNMLGSISSEIFSSMENLKFLYMDNNNLLSISSEAFANTRNLKYVNMENNQISLRDFRSSGHPTRGQFEIYSPFRYLTGLEILNLRKNSISNIFRDWKLNMRYLQNLDLSYNNITIITDYDLRFLSRHISVNLTHNSIETIYFNRINRKKKESQKILVAMDHNPLNCDCKVLFFVQFLNEVEEQLKGVLKVSADELKCSAPQNLEGSLATKIAPKELICPLDDDSRSEKQCPIGCSCWLRPFDTTLVVNCSNGEFTKIPPLPIYRNRTELYMENNNLTELPLATTPGYNTVIQLHAANNSLTAVSVDNLPKFINYVNVSHNKLQGLNDSLLKTFNESRCGLALSHNPWLCDCTSQNLLLFVQTNYEQIKDLKEMQCVSGKKFQKLSPEAICPIKQGLVIAVSVTISVIGVCFGILAALYYKYQREIKVWLYAHNMCLWLVAERELEKDKKYDAFISYSHKDEDLITDYLVPELENGPTPFKLCIFSRDVDVGGLIPDQTIQLLDDSRRIIIVLSPSFIESDWARMEFRAAQNAALNEGRARVIVIIYGDIGDIDTLDPELKAYLKMNTYLKWGDPWFWNKLRYAMPHPSNNLSRHVNTALQTSADNELDVIKPSPNNTRIATTLTEANSNSPLMIQLTPETNGNIDRPCHLNGELRNGHTNEAFVINTNSK